MRIFLPNHEFEIACTKRCDLVARRAAEIHDMMHIKLPTFTASTPQTLLTSQEESTPTKIQTRNHVKHMITQAKTGQALNAYCNPCKESTLRSIASVPNPTSKTHRMPNICPSAESCLLNRTHMAIVASTHLHQATFAQRPVRDKHLTPTDPPREKIMPNPCIRMAKVAQASEYSPELKE